MIELREKLQFVDSKFWTVVVMDEVIVILHIKTNPAPKVKFSLVINSNLYVHAFVEDLEIYSLGKYKMPCVVNNVYVIEELMNHISKYRSMNKKSSGDEGIGKLHIILTMIKSIMKDGYIKNVSSL